MTYNDYEELCYLIEDLGWEYYLYDRLRKSTSYTYEDEYVYHIEIFHDPEFEYDIIKLYEDGEEDLLLRDNDIDLAIEYAKDIMGIND